MLTVTRRFEISYSHRLPGYQGQCANLHGHNAHIEVSFSHLGIQTGAYPGMIIDFKDINSKVGKILDEFDHAHLNDMEYFKDINPTAENMTLTIANLIMKDESIKAQLVSVKITETSDSWAMWTNDGESL